MNFALIEVMMHNCVIKYREYLRMKICSFIYENSKICVQICQISIS